MKHLLISLFLLIPLILFAQDKVQDKAADSNRLDLKKEPVLSVFTKLFKMKNLTFIKEQDGNKGETLETMFQLENQTNVPLDFYVFVIATYEKGYITRSSFQPLELDDPNFIKLIQVFPDDLPNFEYITKDNTGAEKKVYQKYPKNIKAGVNPKTGKPYRLEDITTVRAFHLSKYMRNYYYFNNVTILIFDTDEKLLFRRSYSVTTVKR